MSEAPRPPQQASEPVPPRPAATVVLLRRGGRHADRGLEVCLVKRNPAARFMPGVWVFPGGSIDDGDRVDAGGEIPADEVPDEAYRAAAVRELLEEAGVEVAPEDLIPFSRWITPEAVPIRFDTRFYLALAPAHSPPRPDGSETVDAGWFDPAEALAAFRREEIKLVFPTIKTLEALSVHASAEEAIEAVREQTMEPVLPRVVGEGEGLRILLPGEPGYDD